MKQILTLLLILTNSIMFSQADTIFDQGVNRTFILHLPENYNPNNQYPIVLNLHGLGSTAFEQLLYSEFNTVADENGFIVVYADAINNSWDLFGNTDVTFLSNLVDTIRSRYSTNDCLFSMGMSQGGFLSYKLACELDHALTAIAVVTGNMLTFWQDNCSAPDALPVMHFHGTADNVVAYNGSFGVSPVEETAQWWADHNQCEMKPEITSLPDIDPNDGSTAERIQYSDCTDEKDVVLYKINNGGHTWPGAIHIPSFGNTNQDIHASSLIGDFFSNHCALSTGINHVVVSQLHIYPNPASDIVYLHSENESTTIQLSDFTGRVVFIKNISKGINTIDCNGFPNGTYVLSLISKELNIYSISRLVITK